MKGMIVTVLFLTILGHLGALEWYRTSASGVPGTPIYGDTPGLQGWSLSIEHGGEGEIRTLYSDGILQGSTIFQRKEGRLMAREERDADGSVITRVEYAYDAEGNPRAVFIGTDTPTAEPLRVLTDQPKNADTDMRRVAGGVNGDWVITDLDTSQNPVRRVSLESEAVAVETSWNRDSNGRLQEEIRRQGDDITRSFFDSEGRLVEESVTRNNAVVRLRTYTWSDTDLVRVEERGEGRLSVREIAWSGGRMTREIRSIDGVKVSETEWTSTDERVETLYRDGNAVIRVFWSGDARIREEFLKEGEVVRIRGSER